MRGSGRSRRGPKRWAVGLLAAVVLLLALAVPAGAAALDISGPNSPDGAGTGSPGQTSFILENPNPFDPDQIGIQQPSLVHRAIGAMLNWVYQVLASLVGQWDTHNVVFGCQNPSGSCSPIGDGRWQVFGVADRSVYDSVIRPWQTWSWTLGTGLFLGAVMWLAYEYLFGAFNLHSRLSLSERVQWLGFAVILMALAPYLVGVALDINLDLTRAFGGAAGVYSLEAAFSQALQSGRTQLTIAVPLAMLSTIFIRLALLVTYITRAWVVSLLWALAPLLGGALLLFPRLRPVVGSYWRLILAEIFMQSIHAAMLAFVFSWTQRAQIVDPMMVFSLCFAFWMFASALRGVLFGPGSAIAQAAGLGSAAAAALFAISSYQNLKSLAAGLGSAGGAAAGAVLRGGGRGGPAVASDPGPIAAPPAGDAVMADVGAGSGELLRPPSGAEHIARWRQVGSVAGRVVIGGMAGVVGAAAGAAFGDTRLGLQMSRIGAELGERIGHAVGGGLFGGARAAKEVFPYVGTIAHQAKALGEAAPDMAPAERQQFAVSLAGGMPAELAGTREGFLAGARQIGAAVGYGLAGRYGVRLGASLGERSARRYLASSDSVLPSLESPAVSNIISNMQPGDEFVVQVSNQHAILTYGDGENTQKILLQRGDPSLAPDQVALRRYRVVEAAPGVRVPVQVDTKVYSPQTAAWDYSLPGLDFGGGSSSKKG